MAQLKRGMFCNGVIWKQSFIRALLFFSTCMPLNEGQGYCPGNARFCCRWVLFYCSFFKWCMVNAASISLIKLETILFSVRNSQLSPIQVVPRYSKWWPDSQYWEKQTTLYFHRACCTPTTVRTGSAAISMSNNPCFSAAVLRWAVGRPLGNTPPTAHGGWSRTSPGFGTATQNSHPAASHRRTRTRSPPRRPAPSAALARRFLPGMGWLRGPPPPPKGGRADRRRCRPGAGCCGTAARRRWGEAERGSGGGAAGGGGSAAVFASPASGLASSVGAGARPAAGARPRYRAAVRPWKAAGSARGLRGGGKAARRAGCSRRGPAVRGSEDAGLGKVLCR